MASIRLETCKQYPRCARHHERWDDPGAGLLQTSDDPAETKPDSTHARYPVPGAEPGINPVQSVWLRRADHDHCECVRLRGERGWPCLVTHHERPVIPRHHGRI